MKMKLLLVLILLQITYGCANSVKGLSTVYVVNKSSYEIISGTLRAGDQTFEISNLKPGEEVHFNYTPRSDCNYLIKIKFSSGKRLEKGVGYITGGFNYKDVLTITDKDVILTPKTFLK